MRRSLRIHVRAKAAFSLIEALVVIVIIAIALGFLFPARIGPRSLPARKSQAKNAEMIIETAIKAYYAEYGKYPVANDSGDAAFGMTTSNDLLFDVLRDDTASARNATAVKALNPRDIVFLDVPPVKDDRHPVSGIGGKGSPCAGVWFDPWGSPYNVLIDANQDGKLENPYIDAPGGGILATGVIVWSFGKNGILGGGPAVKSGFVKEGGTADYYKGSGDVVSWQ